MKFSAMNVSLIETWRWQKTIHWKKGSEGIFTTDVAIVLKISDWSLKNEKLLFIYLIYWLYWSGWTFSILKKILSADKKNNLSWFVCWKSRSKDFLINKNLSVLQYIQYKSWHCYIHSAMDCNNIFGCFIFVKKTYLCSPHERSLKKKVLFIYLSTV